MDGLEFLFKEYPCSYREVSDLEALQKKYRVLSQNHGFEFLPPEALVNRVGYRFLRSKEEDQWKKVLAFFKLNTENYPQSSNAFDSLAEAEYKLGDLKAAQKQ